MFEHTNHEVLETLVLIRVVERLPLEDQQWFQIFGDVLCILELVHASVLLDTHLKHIEDVTIKNAP